jgi:hypothetical protein
MPRRLTAPQVLLGLVGLASLELGVWATIAPRSFYEDFPGGGRAWVSVDGPYNEHLIRDFGGLNLALAIVLLTAAVLGGVVLMRVASAAALAFGLPHLVYHLRHLDVYDTGDQIANSAALMLAIAGPLVALVMTLRTERSPASLSPRADSVH